MKNPPFFIVGLPRSRTAWLANLLTTGPSLCFHEMTKYYPEISKFVERMREETGNEFYGDADCGLLAFNPEYFYQQFPDSKIVVITRSFKRCEASFRQYFKRETQTEYWRELDNMLENWRKLPCLNIPFYELENPRACRMLFEFCLPGVKFDLERWKMLNYLNVQVIPAKWENELTPELREKWKNLPVIKGG